MVSDAVIVPNVSLWFLKKIWWETVKRVKNWQPSLTSSRTVWKPWARGNWLVARFEFIFYECRCKAGVRRSRNNTCASAPPLAGFTSHGHRGPKTGTSNSYASFTVFLFLFSAFSTAFILLRGSWLKMKCFVCARRQFCTQFEMELKTRAENGWCKQFHDLQAHCGWCEDLPQSTTLDLGASICFYR